MPKVSVIISVYNGQRFISKAIESVLNQSYQNFELLLLDDDSKDNSFLVLKKYLKLYPKKIRLFRNKKTIGLTRSLIKLINCSKGNYIARLDIDDYCDVKRFEMQVGWLVKNKNRALIGSSAYIIDINNKIKGQINLNTTDHYKLKKELLFKNYFLHSSVMFSKIHYYKAGGYNKFYKFSQDYDLWYKMSKIGIIKNTKNNLIYLRHHKNSITTKNKKKQSLYAFIISCINLNKKQEKLGDQNLIKIIKNLRKNTDIKHYNVLSYLYSEHLPKSISKNLFDLSLSELKYSLHNWRFLFNKTLKKIVE